MHTMSEAKQSAAMKACIALYKNGELTDHFTPVSSNNVLEGLEDTFFPHWKQFSDDCRCVFFYLLIHSICCIPQAKKTVTGTTIELMKDTFLIN